MPLNRVSQCTFSENKHCRYQILLTLILPLQIHLAVKDYSQSFRNANSVWIWSLISRVELLTKRAFSKSTSCKPSDTLSVAFNAITQHLSNNTKTPQTPQQHRRLEESKGIDSLTKPTGYWVSSLWVTKSTSVNIDWNWSYPTAQDHIIQCNCQQSQWQSKREMKHSCPLKSKYSLVGRKENQSCSCLFKREYLVFEPVSMILFESNMFTDMPPWHFV